MHELWDEMEVLVTGDCQFGLHMEVAGDLQFEELSACSRILSNSVHCVYKSRIKAWDGIGSGVAWLG